MIARILLAVVLALSAITFFPPHSEAHSEARSETRVKAHIKKSGKPVSAHKRKSPNSNKLDNYGTKGNVNPHTGNVGKEDPFAGKVKR